MRWGPSPLKSAVASPPATVSPLVLLFRSENELLKFCGSCMMTSLMSVRPPSWISLAVTTWIGLVLVALGRLMREPVITTSSTGAALEGGSSWADAI